MNKIAVVALLVIAGVAVSLAQAPAPAPAAKAPNSVQQAVKQLEHDWEDALKAGDADKLGEILADDWMSIGYDGKKATKQEELADVKSGKAKLESYELGPMEVKVLGNVAVVQGSDTKRAQRVEKTPAASGCGWMCL